MFDFVSSLEIIFVGKKISILQSKEMLEMYMIRMINSYTTLYLTFLCNNYKVNVEKLCFIKIKFFALFYYFIHTTDKQ